MSEELSGRLRAAARFLRTFIKWLAIASVTGAVGGLIGSAFHLSVDGANSLRESFPWLLWLLPVIGVLIALIYRYTHLESEGTNAVIDSIHLGEKIPLALVPVIFASTVLTHLGGGSAGREGAALQIGGGLGWSMGRLFRLDDKDMRLATLCGMSALFSALFGTPLTATIFALEVISVGVVYYSGLVPCLTAALAAFGVTQLFDIAPTRFTVEAPALSADMLWRVAVLGIACAAMSIVFCETMHKGERLISRAVRNPYLRAAAGGLVIIALTYLCGTTDYNGAGTAVNLPRRHCGRGGAPGLCAEAPLYGCHARLRLPRRRGRSDLLHRRDARLRPGSASGHTGGLRRGGGTCCALLRGGQLSCGLRHPRR